MFVLVTLGAWTGAAFFFVLLKRAPVTRGEPLLKYYVPLCSLLPWLAGYVFWAKVRKRAKAGIDDRDATHFCFSVVFAILYTAYAAMAAVGTAMLWVLVRAR